MPGPTAKAKLHENFPSLEVTIRTRNEGTKWAAELESRLPGCRKFAWKNYGPTESEAVDRVFTNAYFHYVESPAYSGVRKSRAVQPPPSDVP